MKTLRPFCAALPLTNIISMEPFVSTFTGVKNYTGRREQGAASVAS